MEKLRLFMQCDSNNAVYLRNRSLAIKSVQGHLVALAFKSKAKGFEEVISYF